MKLEEQVCSLELAKRIKELGVKQGSFFIHFAKSVGDGFGGKSQLWKIVDGRSIPHPCVNEHYSAFTVAELGEMLPARLQLNGSCDWWSAKEGDGWECKYRYYASANQLAPTEADARAKMLIYLLENGPISTY
jgi:hypothetical protein